MGRERILTRPGGFCGGLLLGQALGPVSGSGAGGDSDFGGPQDPVAEHEPPRYLLHDDALLELLGLHSSNRLVDLRHKHHTERGVSGKGIMHRSEEAKNKNKNNDYICI